MRTRIILVVVFMLFSCGRIYAVDYYVGPGRTYTQLTQVAGLVGPGDLVLVDGNATYNAASFTGHGTAQNPITLRGVRINGNRPILSGGANSLRLAGDHYIVEGFDITGGTSRCVYHEADDVTIRDTVVHGCTGQGIAGADAGSGSLTLEYVEIYNSGSGTQSHPIYAESDEVNYPNAVFRMRYCYLHNNNGGNAVKSRSGRNEIYYNWIENSLYRALELIGAEIGYPAQPPGLLREDSDVVGNVLIQAGSNPMIRIGGDKVDAGSSGRYRFVNNTMVISSSSAIFQGYLEVESVEMHNNVIYRTNGSANLTDFGTVNWVSGRVVGGSNNWIQTGASNVPAEWTDSVTGTSPGFVDAVGLNYAPIAGSVLIDRGTGSPQSPTGHAFPTPLMPPVKLPPPHVAGLVGSEQNRPISGTIDIGAYEYATGADTTPSPFSFSDITGVALSTVIYSTSVQVLAIDTTTAISLSGTGCEYRINTGSWATANGNVALNDSVALRVTSSGTYSTAKSCILTMGGVADTWTVTTVAAARTPVVPTIREVQ